MNREIILKVFEEAIRKCGRVSTRDSVSIAFKRVAEKYGLTLKKYEIEKSNEYETDRFHYDIAYTLTDKEHHTKLVFTEKFLDDNTIAFNQRGNHKNHSISIDELIEGYLNLPNNNKDSVNQIIFKYIGDDEYYEGVMGESKFMDESAKELNTISIFSSYFDKHNPMGEGYDNYDLVLSHESMHCLNFRTLSNDEYQLYQTYFNLKNLHLSDKELDSFFREWGDKSIRETSKEIDDGYHGSIRQNEQYLRHNGISDLNISKLNKASDYGASSQEEDLAEAGAMITLGFHNPNNPKAVLRWDGDTMQYREWVKLHPYQARYLIKQIYDEDVSIEELFDQVTHTKRNYLPSDDNDDEIRAIYENMK